MAKRTDNDYTQIIRDRHSARELLMRIAFQMEAQKDSSDAPLFMHLEDKDIKEELEAFIVSTYHRLVLHLDEIDRAISRHAKGWSLARLPKAELAILRVAACEILYMEDMPDAAACDEAVELAKEYGDENAPAYINGILGSIIREKDESAAD